MLLWGENVGKNFGGLAAVRNLDFSVNEDEILGLIGPNGAGKTTLFNLIMGYYKPDSGKIFFKSNIFLLLYALRKGNEFLIKDDFISFFSTLKFS